MLAFVNYAVFNQKLFLNNITINASVVCFGNNDSSPKFPRGYGAAQSALPKADNGDAQCWRRRRARGYGKFARKPAQDLPD